MNGILNVYKEQGYTSHDVVAILRRVLKTKKIGHTGTLDPNAEGVLPICIGKATKVSELLMQKNKTYLVSFALGKTTDTQDQWGNVLSEHEVDVSPDIVEQVVYSFVGDRMQIPPMYSAIKQDGKKLYELARQGKVIERKARPITIYRIADFKQIDFQVYQFRVTCSKGSYIRTLCHDIGQKIGCGGYMTALVRTQSGAFSIEQALKLNEIENLANNNRIESKILPIPLIFQLPHLFVDKSYCKWLYAGNPVPVDKIYQWSKIYGGNKIQSKEWWDQNNSEKLYYLYDYKEEFIGIYKIVKDTLKVQKFMY